MISNQEQLMIKHMYQQGVVKAKIARELDLDPRTVKKALLEEEYLKGSGTGSESRGERLSILDPYKLYIKSRLSKYNLTSVRLLREIKEEGYLGSYTILKDFVREIRPPKSKPAFVRFETPPGEQGQSDWAEFGTIPYEGGMAKLYCFSMVLGYSRCMYVEFTLSEDLFHLCEAHIKAFEYFGGIPKTVLYDNMKTVVISRETCRFPTPEGEIIQDKIRWNDKFIDFANFYGFLPQLCRKGRKETKGKVERPFSYIRSSFYEGLESLESLEYDVSSGSSGIGSSGISGANALVDLNQKARHWLDSVANVRIHQTTGCVPFDRLKEEQSYLIHLPVGERRYEVDVSWTETRKSYKDCYISYNGNRYSVPYLYSCRELNIKVEGKRLLIYDKNNSNSNSTGNGNCIATHKISYLKGQMITDPKHFEGMKVGVYPLANFGIAAIKELFLTIFSNPNSDLFVEGLLKRKYGNAKYHLAQILALTDQYPKEQVMAAIEKTIRFGAFEFSAVRNICQSQHTELKLKDIDLDNSNSANSASSDSDSDKDKVEERPLTEYETIDR